MRRSRACAASRTWGSTRALWLALGAAGGVVDRRRRARWRRATATVGAAYALNTAIKLRRAPPAPAARGPAAADRHADGALVPQRARLDPRSPPRAPTRRLLPAGAAVRASPSPMALCRLYLGVHYPSDVAGGRRRSGRGSGAWADDEGRHRRHAQRGQVLAVQRAHEGGRGGGELPVHDDRAERRRRARARRAPRAASRRRSAPRTIVYDTIDFHDIAGLVRGRARGRGARQPVPRQHPRDRRDRARRARPRRRERGAPRGHASTRCGHRDDRDRARATPTSSRPSAGSSASCATARAGDKAAIAEEAWLRAVIDALQAGQAGAHGARSRPTRPTRRATCRR